MASLPHRHKIIGAFEVKWMYKEPLKIKNEKYIHLQQLKSVLPKHTWQYYDNLPHYNKQ